MKALMIVVIEPLVKIALKMLRCLNEGGAELLAKELVEGN